MTSHRGHHHQCHASGRTNTALMEPEFIIHPVTARPVLRKRKRQCTSCNYFFEKKNQKKTGSNICEGGDDYMH